MHIHFIFIGEGSSDNDILSHLENLCIEAGADEVTGTTIDYQRLDKPIGKSVADKLNAAIQLEPEANLFFIHRDADARDSATRYNEINSAVQKCQLQKSWVCVVPIQETEAWLLLDEQAIRAVVGNVSGRTLLGLPSPTKVETIAQPKEFLQQALIAAAEVSGLRLAQLRKNFSIHRRKLLLDLPIDGPLTQVASWQRMRDDLIGTVARLSEEKR